MKVTRLPLTWYSDKINQGKVFSFSRYGNGEFDCMKMRDATKKNASGHHYFPKLGAELEDALQKGIKQANHFVGMQNMCIRQAAWRLPPFVKQLDYTWHYSDVFHSANVKGEAAPLFKALRKKKIFMVGPKYITGLQKYIPFLFFQEIPLKDCWLVKQQVENNIMNARGFMKNKDMVIVFVASLMTDVVIADLFPLIGDKVWMLNLGSMFDPYCGKITRSYHKRMRADVMERNTCADI